MIDRKIKLALDEKKQESRVIRTEIPQKSSILLVLFSMYLRFLFFKIKNKHTHVNIKISSFIDDVVIEVELKSDKEDCQLLIEIV